MKTTGTVTIFFSNVVFQTSLLTTRQYFYSNLFVFRCGLTDSRTLSSTWDSLTWTCVTIYLSRPCTCTGHNVYAVAYMCTPRDNDDANTLIANVIVTVTTCWYWAWPSSVQLLVGLHLQIIVCFWHEHAAFQWLAFGRSTAGNDVVATIFISLFLFLVHSHDHFSKK